MIAWIKNRLGRADRQRRFLLALETILVANGTALVGTMKRHEELFAIQASTVKLAAGSQSHVEMLALMLADREEIKWDEAAQKALTDFKALLAESAANRKSLLDAVARAESESDARRCQIEQMEEALTVFKGGAAGARGDEFDAGDFSSALVQIIVDRMAHEKWITGVAQVTPRLSELKLEFTELGREKLRKLAPYLRRFESNLDDGNAYKPTWWEKFKLEFALAMHCPELQRPKLKDFEKTALLMVLTWGAMKLRE